MPSNLPAFDDPRFLQEHVQSILEFYEPRVIGPEAGLRSCFLDNGDCYDPDSRQLVGSARYVVNYATAHRLYGKPHHRQWAERGMDYLTRFHRQDNGGYAWLLQADRVVDGRVMAYGHAFVLLAAASCVRAGIESARATLQSVHEFMESRFWDEQASAYTDERDASLENLDDYRGQNANMHMCEALLAAWQATGENHFLDRSARLAERFAFDLANRCGGMIWEHYDRQWQADMDYNRDKPNDRYRPWGFQPGHQLEWAKLLLMLDEARPDSQWLVGARRLHERAMASGWDPEHGGIVYGVAPDGSFCAPEKYFWVHSEAFAALWRLYQATGEEQFLADYRRIWAWSWEHLVDHVHGAWFRVRQRDGSPIDDRKSPLGKTDYHTLGACWDVLSVPAKPAAPDH